MHHKILLSVLFTFLFFNSQAQRKINQSPVPAKVKIERLGNEINSEASDFAPTRYGDRIYFTSLYKKTVGEEFVTRIYSFVEGYEPILEKDLNMKRKSAHIAHVAFMPDASRMYFSICRDDDQENCTLWYRDRKFEGGWGAAQKLPEYINQRGSTTTMPSIGWDEEQKKFALFFVSDRAGGHGGKDIWVSHISFDGKFATPYTLPINTAQDDVTPYFDRNSQILYFSSNGLKGSGRFDIFQAEKKGDMWNKPENMGRPYNSAYDDLYYMAHGASGSAYFTSDRPGSTCRGNNIDGWNCYDIYQVKENEEYEIYTQKNKSLDTNMVMHTIEN